MGVGPLNATRYFLVGGAATTLTLVIEAEGEQYAV